MKRVAILISGGGSNMVSLVQDMTGDHPARPVLVLSNEPEAGGLSKAADLGVPPAQVNHRDFDSRDTFEQALTARLEAETPDILCLAGFMRILTPAFVTYWQGRILNIHPSLLPKYKGLNTHARALEARDTRHGCSVHLVTAELDAGRLLGQADVPVRAGDTADTLAARVLTMEHLLYPKTLRHLLEGREDPVFLSFEDVKA